MTLETEKQAKHICFRCDVKLDAAEASETPCTRVEPASGWQTAARCKQNVCSDKAALTKALQRSSPLWPTLEPIVRSLYNDARARRSDAKKSKKSGVKTSRKRKVKPVRRPPRPQPTTKAGSNSDDQFNSNF